MICLPPQGTPPHTAADTAHSAHSTQPALRPHRATPKVENKPPQTRRPHSIGMLAPFGGPRPRVRAKARERWFTPLFNSPSTSLTPPFHSSRFDAHPIFIHRETHSTLFSIHRVTHAHLFAIHRAHHSHLLFIRRDLMHTPFIFTAKFIQPSFNS